MNYNFKPVWILESNVFSERCFDEMISFFHEKNITHHVVRIIPFSHDVVGSVPQVHGRPVICYGSIGIQKLAQREGWTPGIWTSDDINESKLVDGLGDAYLNSDAKLMPLESVTHYMRAFEHRERFLKPDEDSKVFAGQILTADEIDTMVKNMKQNDIDVDFKVVVSSPKRIGREWRCVIVDREIASCSLYREYQQVRSREELPIEVEEFVNNVIKRRWWPLDVFVLDIVETDDGLKVIEMNTFNSAGLYECNVREIITKINKLVTFNYACDEIAKTFSEVGQGKLIDVMTRQARQQLKEFS